jgi:hypothetical protein
MIDPVTANDAGIGDVTSDVKTPDATRSRIGRG